MNQSLKQFTKAALEASKPKLADLEISMDLPIKYAKHLYRLIKLYDISDFTCTDNGILKEFKGVNGTSYLNISISYNPVTTNMILVDTDSYNIAKTYSILPEFKKIIDFHITLLNDKTKRT